MPHIIHEDSDILVVEKPAGIAVYPVPRSNKETVAERLFSVFPELRTLPDNGAVHRLDVETSGLLLFARNETAYYKLREDFGKNRIQKEYRTLVGGTITKKGKIDWPIGPDPRSSKRVKVYRNLIEARRHKAQEAVTVYAPISVGAPFMAPQPQGVINHAPTTLLQIRIKTGRRHQIRAHLAAIGHPIVGDKLYGGPPADRLYLYATFLRFIHPTGKQEMEFHL